MLQSVDTSVNILFLEKKKKRKQILFVMCTIQILISQNFDKKLFCFQYFVSIFTFQGGDIFGEVFFFF